MKTASNERRPGRPMAKVAGTVKIARFAMIVAGVEPEEIDIWDDWSDEDINDRVLYLAKQIEDCEWRKKMRRNARDHKDNRRMEFEVEDGNMLKMSSTEKITIDRVPPLLRRRIANGEYGD